MFNDLQWERDNAQWNDALTQGERMTGACQEYAQNIGSERPEQAWILTDYDTWVENPHYTGKPVPHPESGDDGYEDDGQPSTYEEYQDLHGGDDWDHGQYDDVPF
jgi:hypothetical protein